MKLSSNPTKNESSRLGHRLSEFWPIPNAGGDNALCKAYDLPAGHVVAAHCHNLAQLVFAARGVMVICRPEGRWLVPPTRALWLPPLMEHEIRCIGEVHMRCVYIEPTVVPELPDRPQTVSVDPLLRELIVAATSISSPVKRDSRDSHLLELLIDELRRVPRVPLYLPQPAHQRLAKICEHINSSPHDTTTLEQWAVQLNVSSKTIGRMFAQETGMTFRQWRLQARMMYGLELLAVGEKVVDVALSCGYDSPSAFSFMFRRQFGLTPSAFFDRPAL
ncbi:AraC family transcriptional regulator [Comamonas testosteroni]|uniref:AraC family transcriptional regulator n=1 Tax=Comamonas testosteroni TaxID=285 RepID=UPI00389AA3A0